MKNDRALSLWNWALSLFCCSFSNLWHSFACWSTILRWTVEVIAYKGCHCKNISRGQQQRKGSCKTGEATIYYKKMLVSLPTHLHAFSSPNICCKGQKLLSLHAIIFFSKCWLTFYFAAQIWKLKLKEKYNELNVNLSSGICPSNKPQKN